jgi:hypothetical protein
LDELIIEINKPGPYQDKHNTPHNKTQIGIEKTAGSQHRNNTKAKV